MKFQVFDFGSTSIPDLPGIVWFLQDEWDRKNSICRAFIASKDHANVRLDARKCSVEEISDGESAEFLNENHLQGRSRRSVVRYGLRESGVLVGIVSLARHHRQGNDMVLVLDRVCFRAGITVRGGLSRLVSRCRAYAVENDFDLILTFSDNRLTDGSVYETVGFVFDGGIRPDYFYVDPDLVRHSKQSQKKRSSGCPGHLTEFEWAQERGLRRITDLGKKRWVLKVNPEALTKKEKLSLRCAEMHSSGIFRKNAIRGELDWRGVPTYFGSSLELRFLFETREDPKITMVRRADYFQTEGRLRRGRNPDFLVTFADGRREIVEVKPSERVHEFREQIKDSREYALVNGLDFRLWTELNSTYGQPSRLGRWGRRYLASIGQDRFLVERMEKDRQKARKHYHSRLAGDKVVVSCEYCEEDHEIRREQYEDNVRSNGRYICIIENGHIVGIRPKTHLIKENPYAGEEKKRCLGPCGQVRPLDEFGTDKSRRDGYASRCKECRRKKNRSTGRT